MKAQSPADSPSVTIKSSVRMVEVDVIAKDKHGNPVPGLEAKDFTLLDDGKPQEITHISVEGGSPAEQERTGSEALSQPSRTTFSNSHPENVVPTVILFDVLNTSLEDQLSMKKALISSLNHVKEGTPIALLILGDDLTVVSEFTTSSILLTRAAGVGVNARQEGFGPPITARATGNPTRDRIILKATTQALGAENSERIARTMAALNVICSRLSSMKGRKSLLWITGGLSNLSETKAMEEVIDKLNDANIAVYTVDARGVLLDPGLGAENDNKDLAGPFQMEREETRGDVLPVVAAATGGVFFGNTNRLDLAINRALEDRRLVYVLDYYPRHGKWQGKLHKLEVKTSRAGVRLRYRASYRATPPVRPNAQEQQQMLVEIESSPMESSALRFSVEVKSGPPADPQFVLHVPAEEVQWSSEEGKMLGSLQVWFIQKRASGEDIVTARSKADLRMTMDAYQGALRQGIALASNLNLQQSADKVRVMVRDEISGKIGTVDVPVGLNFSKQQPR